MYPTVSTPSLTSGSSKGDPPNPISLVLSRRIRVSPALPPSPAFACGDSQCSAPPAHDSHAADGPLGNGQSSDSYGSFKPPFFPNNPSSGAVLIPSHRQPLGMPGPSLGRINRCAVIFTQQLPARIPLPQPAHQPQGRLLTEDTLKARPAGQDL